MNNIKKFGEFLNEEYNDEKDFLVHDKTGKTKPIKFSKLDLENTLDLNEIDYNTEISLGDYLENCIEGDCWETEDTKIECF